MYPPDSTTITTRLGHVLGWTGNGFALLFGAIGVTALVNSAEPIIGWGMIGLAVIALLVGQALRYILAGPVPRPGGRPYIVQPLNHRSRSLQELTPTRAGSMGPIRRTINFILALTLSILGVGSLVFLLFFATHWRGWVVMGSSMVGFLGLYWLWTDFIKADPHLED